MTENLLAPHFQGSAAWHCHVLVCLNAFFSSKWDVCEKKALCMSYKLFNLESFSACKVIYRTIFLNTERILLCLYQNFYPWFNDSVLQPEELHLSDHKEDSSICEPARTEKKEQENDSSVIVKIQASGILIFYVLYSTTDA